MWLGWRVWLSVASVVSVAECGAVWLSVVSVSSVVSML